MMFSKATGHLKRIILLVMLLNSCKLGPNYTRQVETVPKSYNQEFPSDTAIANIPWWELFQDSILVNLIWETLENNRDLKSAVARIDESRANIGIARTDLYPRINYTAGGNTSVNTAASG